MTRTSTAIAALAALAWPIPSTGAASAQETTVQEALERLQQGEQVHGQDPNEPAIRILRQLGRWGEHSPRTPAELDALADRLAEIALDATLPADVRSEAIRALANASHPVDAHYDGTPYPRAFDLLVKVHEGTGRHDGTLTRIMWADPVRGPAYVRGVFERSEPPPLCYWGHGDRLGNPRPGHPPVWCDEGHRPRPTPFCRVGELLFSDTVNEAWKRTPGYPGLEVSPDGDTIVLVAVTAGEPWPVPEGLPEHVDDWHRRCR